MPARLVSRAEFARLAGVSKAAITKACRGLLSAACDGDRINIDHPAAASYLAGKAGAPPEVQGAGGSGGAAIPARAPTKSSRPTAKKLPTAARAPTEARPKAAKASKRPTTVRPPKAAKSQPPSLPAPPEPPIPAPKELRELEEVNRLLVPLVEQFGTSRRLRDWVLSLKDIESIRAKYLANEEMQGRLISRELVQANVMGVLAGLMRKLLKDTPKTIARKLAGHFAAKGTVEEAERIVRDSLTSQINPVKERTVRTLRSA